MASIRALPGLLLLALAAPATAGTIWHVDATAACPGTGSHATPFCTIQAALDAAAPGDEILVQPGLYTETIDFLGKDVELRSTVAAVVTIIDGGRNGSVVSFVNGEGRGAVLEGFTLRNGWGVFEGTGGGIQCAGSSPTIRGNNIEVNTAEWGGGIQVVDGAPLLIANSIHDNVATYGGGIYCQGAPSVDIIGNQISSNGPPGTTGGGIAVQGGAAHIEANLIQTNITSSGAGLYIETSYPVLVRGNTIRSNHTDEGDGGGLFVFGDLVVVEDNEIEHNSAIGEGGALWAEGGTYRNNRFFSNVSGGGWGVVARQGASFDGDQMVDNGDLSAAVKVDGPALAPPVQLKRVTITETDGLALQAFSGALVMEDCLIADNEEGLLVSGAGTVATLRRCTFSGHELSAASAAEDGHATLESCIVWGNALATGLELFPDTGTIDASYSIVRLGYPGLGNSAADPLFANPAGGDYSLLPGSPAIDTGNPMDGVTGFDLTNTPRRLDGLLDVGSEVDRGALEFDNVKLATSSPAAGVLKIDLTGTAGLQTVILAAPTTASLPIEKWGTLGLNLIGPWISAPWPGAPSSIQVNVAPAFSGLPLALQALAGPPGQLGFTGNLSNVESIQLP